jgi:hypothetical protein
LRLPGERGKEEKIDRIALVAQSAERVIGKDEVIGSNPIKGFVERPAIGGEVIPVKPGSRALIFLKNGNILIG